MKKALLLLAWFSFSITSAFSQYIDPNHFSCSFDGDSGSPPPSGCTYTSDYPWSLSDFYPVSSTVLKTVSIRFIVIQNPNKTVTKPEGTYNGTFIDNSESQKMISDIVNSINSTYTTLITDISCTTPILSDTRFRVVNEGVTFVTDVTGNCWANYNTEQCPLDGTSTSSWDCNQYLTNYTTELNIFLTEEPSHFDYLVYGTGADNFNGQWCAAIVPGTPDASVAPNFNSVLKVNARGVFAGFYADKFVYPGSVQYPNAYWNSTVTSYDSPNNTYWWLVNGVAWGLAHEIGHNLGLKHVTGCNNIMDGSGSSQRHYLTSDQLGVLEKAAYLQATRSYIAYNYDATNKINITLAVDNWNYDIKSYNDVIVKNAAVLNVNCKVTMPLGGKITIESGGKLVLMDNAEIDLSSNGYIQINDGGTLEIQNNASGKGIVFNENNTNYVLVQGTLKFTNGADFTIQGKGYYKFDQYSSLILSTGSEVNLNNGAQGTKMLELDNKVITIDGHHVTLKNGDVIIHNNSKLKITNGSLDINHVTFDGYTSTPSGNEGLYASGITSVCDIKNCAFSDVVTGLELRQVADPLQVNVNTCTFSNCASAIKAFQVDKMAIKSCTPTYTSATGSVGVSLNNCKNVTMDGGQIQWYDKGFDLTSVKALYLTSVARIYDCGVGIYGTDSKVYLRNGAKIELAGYKAIEMYGSWNSSTGSYTSMLTMGDNGCASIIDFVTEGIHGNNTILNIDAHVDGGGYDHNWFYPYGGTNLTHIDMCYNQGQASPNSVYMRRNLWCNAGTVSNPAPSSTLFNVRNNTNCFSSLFTLYFIPTSQCIPSTFDCSYCNGQNKLEEDSTGGVITVPGIVSDAFNNAYDDFVVEDNDTTREEFAGVAALGLRYDTVAAKWYVQTVSSVEFETDDSTANQVMIARIINESEDSTQKLIVPPDIFALYYSMLSGQAPIPLSNLSIYPNPSEGKITIESLNNSPIRKLFLMDLFGRVVKLDNLENKINWDISHLPSGMYLLRACDQNGVTLEFRSVSIQ